MAVVLRFLGLLSAVPVVLLLGFLTLIQLRYIDAIFQQGFWSGLKSILLALTGWYAIASLFYVGLRKTPASYHPVRHRVALVGLALGAVLSLWLGGGMLMHGRWDMAALFLAPLFAIAFCLPADPAVAARFSK